MRQVRQNLIDARIAAGLTQEQLAKRVGTTQPTISQYESNVRSPGRRMAKKIAKLLNRDEGWLFDEGIQNVA